LSCPPWRSWPNLSLFIVHAYTSSPSMPHLALPQPRRIRDSLYNTLAIQHSSTRLPEPVRAPDSLKSSTLPYSVRAMLDAGLHVLLAPLSFVLTSPPPFLTLYFAMFSSRCMRSPGQRRGVPCAAHAARCVPHRACKSHSSTPRRRCARQTTTSVAVIAIRRLTRGTHPRPRRSR